MPRSRFASLCLTALLLGGFTALPLKAAPTDSNWVQVWEDECNLPAGSPVDGTKWNLVHSGGGFGNNELQFYTNRTANSYYDGNGNLVIKTLKESYEGYNYTSAKLTSQHKGDWTYCRVQIRAKLPRGRCVWPAFWMMPTASRYGGWPMCGEIDIMELRGDQMNKVGGTLHFGDPWKYIGSSYYLPSGNFDQDYHTFDVEWEPGVIRWYVDGQLYQTRTHTEWYTSGASKSTNPYAPFDQNFYLQLNTAVGGPNTPYTGNQSPDNSVFPQSMYIDYVRVFKRGTNPPVTDKWSGIKAVANGYYVCADNYGNSPLIANREVVEDWERFQVIDNGDGTISFLSKSNGRYVCADLNQDAKLVARSETIQEWEKFKKVTLADGTVALQAMANNNYVSADLNQGGVLYANRPAVGGAWEAFVITEGL